MLHVTAIAAKKQDKLSSEERSMKLQDCGVVVWGCCGGGG